MSRPTHKAEIGLSVDIIAEQAARRDGVPNGTTFSVSREVAGRTRSGEAWSVGESVAVAVLLRPNWRPECADLVWILALLAGARALQSLEPKYSDGQWPDVLSIGDSVVGRSFAKAYFGPGTIDFAVLSVRLDVEAVRKHLSVNVNDLEGAVTKQFELIAESSMGEDSTDTRREFAGFCRTLGQTLEIDLRPKGYVRGTAVDIAENGGLVVESSTGMREIVMVDTLRRLRVL